MTEHFCFLSEVNYPNYVRRFKEFNLKYLMNYFKNNYIKIIPNENVLDFEGLILFNYSILSNFYNSGDI